jgi:23S rRNA (adenine1618-N6)-methyltransferase
MGVGFAMENAWSRQARRKWKSSSEAMQSIEVDASQAALGFKVHLRNEGIEEKGVRVLIRWFKGTDSVLFESFCGMVKRKLEGR